MKQFVFALALLAAPVIIKAQTITNSNVGPRLQQLEDKAALKSVVDIFSILADQKDVRKQVLLFTEDATVESRSSGQPGSLLTGRKQIGDAFSAFLANFETVYHLNGQQTVELLGDRATGTSYCLVVLIGTENGKKVKTTMGVSYNDEFVRRGNMWLISKRVSNFVWRDREEMAQAGR